MKQEVDLEKSVRHIEIFDTGIAFLAGLMIIPAVFAFSGGEDSINEMCIRDRKYLVALNVAANPVRKLQKR